MTQPISLFTPSILPAEVLERLFVGRDRILDSIEARMRSAATSTERNQTLLVGPRGSGKTHLVALAHHRAGRLREEGLAIRRSWLPEDPWTIATYRHLLEQIVEGVDPPIAESIPQSVQDLENAIAEEAQTAGPIVVFVENLDQVLDAVGNDGQQRLRHLLQADRSMLLVATTTTLSRDLSDQAAPFYAFFTTDRLEPLDVATAAEMLSRIALEKGDRETSEYLGTEEARARLLTIAHLAGGQPRIWATLAAALTVPGLRELVDLLLTRFDELTPYYQEQLARLAPQQRRVVAELAGADRPVSVSDLAARLGLGERSVGKTMSELSERGWVRPTDSLLTAMLDRRRTYYELAEPLARLAFQLKASRGEPIRLVVDFLKSWFDPKDVPGARGLDEISDPYLLATVAGFDDDAVFAVARRLHHLPATRAPVVELLGELDDALSALAMGDPEPVLAMPSAIRSAVESKLDEIDPSDRLAITRVRRDVHREAAGELGFVRHSAMHRWIDRANDLIRMAPTSEVAACQLVLSSWLARASRFDEAEIVLAEAERTLGPDDLETLITRLDLASSHRSAGRTDEAIAILKRVVADSERSLGLDHRLTFAARDGLALALMMAGHTGHTGHTGDAIAILEQLVADSKGSLGLHHPRAFAARDRLALALLMGGRDDEAIAILEQLIADRERILGPDHPDATTARHNLAISYWSAGRDDEAIAILEEVVADRERILGADHPDTIAARHRLADWLGT